MERAEVETFKIQNGISCFRDSHGCSSCMNEIPCDWYLSMSKFFAILDDFLQFFFCYKDNKFLILKEGVVSKL